MDRPKLVIQLVTTEEDLIKALDDFIEKKIIGLLSSHVPSAQTGPTEELLTIKQLSLFFQVSETTIHSWKNTGVLPYCKVKSRIRFRRSEVMGLYERIRTKKRP